MPENEAFLLNGFNGSIVEKADKRCKRSKSLAHYTTKVSRYILGYAPTSVFFSRWA